MSASFPVANESPARPPISGWPGLLVSVRTPHEARQARRGGCAVIDVKEPTHGSLGRAGPTMEYAIADAVTPGPPLSAAAGELAAGPMDPPPDPTFGYVKRGLANAPSDWSRRLAGEADRLGRSRFVAAAYADAERVAAPPVHAVLDWALENRVAGLLIDTSRKDGTTLFDWLTADCVRRTIEQARAGGLFVALAGSLKDGDLDRAAALDPDLVAVRGAVCEGNDRTAAITARRVRDVAQRVEAIGNASSPRTAATGQSRSTSGCGGSNQ